MPGHRSAKTVMNTDYADACDLARRAERRPPQASVISCIEMGGIHARTPDEEGRCAVAAVSCRSRGALIASASLAVALSLNAGSATPCFAERTWVIHTTSDSHDRAVQPTDADPSRREAGGRHLLAHWHAYTHQQSDCG